METTTITSLRRRIMYRVYLSFGISLVANRFFWEGLAFGASVALFGRVVHVASVAQNVLTTPLGQLPSYVAYVFEHALLSGEVVTVVTTVALVILGISAARVIARALIATTTYRPV